MPPPPGAPMVEFALDYARRGWPVFPCSREQGSVFYGGLSPATTDEETIRRLVGYWAKAMIGVPMGARSGVWAIDPIRRKAGGAGRPRENGRLPRRWRATSNAHRGYAARRIHIVFKWDPDRPVTNSPGALAKTNIDVRGEGGYIVVASSVCVGDGGARTSPGNTISAKISSTSPGRRTGSMSLCWQSRSPSQSPRQNQRRHSSSPRSSESLTTTNCSGVRSTTSPFKTSALGCRRCSAAPPSSSRIPAHGG